MSPVAGFHEVALSSTLAFEQALAFLLVPNVHASTSRTHQFLDVASPQCACFSIAHSSVTSLSTVACHPCRKREVLVTALHAQSFSLCNELPCLGLARRSLDMSLSLPWTRLVPRWAGHGMPLDIRREGGMCAHYDPLSLSPRSDGEQVSVLLEDLSH